MNENIFKKIKRFFSNIFCPKKFLKEGNIEGTKKQENEFDCKVMTNERKNIFEQAKEQMDLISLQKLYLQGKIQEKDMTKEQIIGLEKLFDTQIENVKRNNDSLRRKIYKSLTSDKKVMEVYFKVKNGEIDENQLTKDQIKQINFLRNLELEKA